MKDLFLNILLLAVGLAIVILVAPFTSLFLVGLIVLCTLWVLCITGRSLYLQYFPNGKEKKDDRPYHP